jgi:hypothetical protein
MLWRIHELLSCAAAAAAAAAITAAAAAELVRQLVANGWLAWGGKLAGKRFSTSRVASDYSGDAALNDLVG